MTEPVSSLEGRSADRAAVASIPAPFSSGWVFIEALGGGGQGATIKVRRRTDNTLGVLKVPRSTDATARERFRREVSILQQTNHPAIVRLLDVNLDAASGEIGYITPLGTPLDVYWPNRVRLLTPTKRYDVAYELVRQIADGLALLHAQLVVHRDLKPENIILIDGKPLVIDFGVALRPDEDRLSVADQRVVANNFATPPSAHYGLHAGGPAWDCLGLAWIYGYLIGEGLRPKQFHWRFHPLLEEPRRDRAKAVLAACSHERTVPRDALGFVALLDQYRLGGVPAAGLTSDASRLDGAMAARAEAQAATMVRRADEMEEAEVGIQMLVVPLNELRDTLNRVCVGNDSLPVTLNAYSEDEFQFPIMPRRPIREILEQVFDHGSQGFSSDQYIFSCTCGSQLRHFDIGVFVGYSPHHVEDRLRFRLGLWCRMDGEKPPLWPEMLIHIHNDGKFSDSDTGQAYSVGELANLAFQWMTEQRHWFAVG